MPPMLMKHDVDPREKLMKDVKQANGIEIFNNKVLVAVYIRPEKTASGLYMAAQTRDEDRYQGKVGMIVKMGATAFDDPSGKWFSGAKFQIGDWVTYRPSDTWQITINGTLCRMMDDISINGRVDHPDCAY